MRKSMADIKKKKRKIKKKEKKEEKEKDEAPKPKTHNKANCALWGCKCQEKQKKKEEPPKRPERVLSMEEIIPYPKFKKIKTMYPRLYQWDMK